MGQLLLSVENGSCRIIIVCFIGFNLCCTIHCTIFFTDQRALVQLRRTEKLRKLVFLSCDPKAAVKNVVDLSRPTSKMYHGAPLVPVCAVPVDMFPHTSHCELIIYFERVDLSQLDNP
jgi:hypothetical protein